jgi:DNA polymerase-3 subunit gamma/tau
MALLKMATLSPVVPVNDILERLKGLEGRTGGALIASAPPAWEPSLPHGASGGRVVGSGSKSMARSADIPRSAASPPRQEPTAAERYAAPQAADGAQNGDSWVAFVSFVKGKKPMLASFLEHGHPLKISASQLEIGFLNGSFQLSRLRDPDAAAELQMLAQEFFRGETKVRLVSLTGEIVVPPSILEKKSLEDADRKQRMKEVATSHPMITAALEIFGGEVGDVKETDKGE